MDKQKIAKQLQELDNLVFKLRMSLTALQSEFYQSVTVSTKVPTDQYSTARFDHQDERPESQTEPKYTGEAVLTDPDYPDGFHGKSYKDFVKSSMGKKSLVLPE